MRKVNLGIIGLGYIGKTHLQHSLSIDNAHLEAAADSSKKALSAATSAGVKKTYTDYEQLLRDPNVDAVIIALPTHLHLQCARMAAEAKKHILLEKPVARNTTEAKEIILAARKNSVRLMIGYHLRFSTEFQELKERLRQQTLGDVEIAYATYISSGPFLHRSESHVPVPVPEWWFSKELTGGGALIDLGVHMINLLRWYFGEITVIKSYLGYRFNMDLEDHAICLTKFESGPTAVISAGWFSQDFRLQIQLFGTVRNLTAERSPENNLFDRVQMLTKGTSRFRQSHLVELKYFANCLSRDVNPSPSGEDGLRDLEAISEAYKNQIPLDWSTE